MQVIGYEIFSGVFNDVSYENVHLYYTQEAKKGEGLRSGFVKIKRNKLPVVLNTLIGQTIKVVYYDVHKNVQEIIFEM